jgi:nicotinamidase/pyrazinamidase
VPNQPGVDVGPLAEEIVRGATQGLYFEKEVYSLFANPNAEALLGRVRALSSAEPELVVFGVATDYCVRAAAEGLLDRGCRVTILEDAIRAIDASNGEAALAELARRGARRATFADLRG